MNRSQVLGEDGSQMIPTREQTYSSLIYLCSGDFDQLADSNLLNQGPLPFPYTDSRGDSHAADEAWRSTRFYSKVTPILYDRRQHLDLRDSPKPGPSQTSIVGVEVLGPPTALTGTGWVLVVLHLQVPGPPEVLDCLRDLLPGHLLPAHLTNTHAAALASVLGPAVTPIPGERVVSCTQVAFDESAPELNADPQSVSPGQQWARALASLNGDGRIIFDDTDPDWARGDVRSAHGQSTSILRDGIGMVHEHASSDPVLASRAATGAQVFYVDILLMAIIQRLGIASLDDHLAVMSSDLSRLRDGVGAIEMALLRLRNEVWWEEISPARPANVALRTVQAQHNLPRRLDQLRSDVQDTARIVENHELRFTNDLLGILTITSVVVGLPAAVVLGAAALIREPAADLAWVAMAVFLFLAVVGSTSLLLWHRGRRRRARADLNLDS